MEDGRALCSVCFQGLFQRSSRDYVVFGGLRATIEVLEESSSLPLKDLKPPKQRQIRVHCNGNDC